MKLGMLQERLLQSHPLPFMANKKNMNDRKKRSIFYCKLLCTHWQSIYSDFLIMLSLLNPGTYFIYFPPLITDGFSFILSNLHQQ